MEKGAGVDVITQTTDLVSSSILGQCLYVLRTVSEFRNLTYRVTKTHNGVEMVVVNRDGVLGIFGAPIDPITLNLDPRGRCSVSIPFKPVQRVSIVSAESGLIEIASLFAVLRMISGKGYLFCPGLPERFLAGKACGKFVVLHKVPFKRYQSPQCPIYYQPKVLPPRGTKSSLFALCPRCMQAVKWIQSLPVCPPVGAEKSVQQPLQSMEASQPQPNKINAGQDNSGNIIKSGSTVVFTSPSCARLVSAPNEPVTAASSRQQQLNRINSSDTSHQKSSNLDINGNNKITVGDHIFSNQRINSEHLQQNVVTAKILEKCLNLRNLQESYKHKSLDTFDASSQTQGSTTLEEVLSSLGNIRSTRGRQRRTNVCRICKKAFSSQANLKNHFQRHMASSGSWHKQYKKKELQQDLSCTSPWLKVGVRQTFFLRRKKPVHFSKTSVKLMLKHLNDMILSQKRTKLLKQDSCFATENKTAVNHIKKQMDTEKSSHAHPDNTEVKAQRTRCGLKRTLSCLSPMETLMEATVVAEVDHLSSPTISSSSLVAVEQQESVVVSTTSLLPTTPAEHIEATVPEKKARKSSRAASKRAKYNKRQTKDENSLNDTADTKDGTFGENHAFLTNLNLLSTVSIEKAKTDARTSIQNQPIFSYTVLLAASSEAKSKEAVSPGGPNSASNPEQRLDNKPERSTQHIDSPSAKKQITNFSVSSSCDLPVMPSYFIKSCHENISTSSYPYPHQQLESQSLLASSTVPPLLNNLASLHNSHPTPSASVPSEQKMDTIPNQDYGAIDLSKPKIFHPSSRNLSVEEKNLGFAFPSGVAPSFTQLISHNKNPEVLQHLLMARTAGFSVKDVREGRLAATNSTFTDSGHQPPMLASSPSYKGEQNVLEQAVITTSNQMGKVSSKTGNKLPKKSDEIQCGYKWNGSGGLVKERTQLVKELVPRHIMENFFLKLSPMATSGQPFSASKSSTSMSQHSTSHLAQSPAEPNKLQDLSEPQLALNLTVNKPTEVAALCKGMSGRSQKSAPNQVTAPSSVCGSSSTSSASSGVGILRSSLTNKPRTVNNSPYSNPDLANVPDHINGKLIKLEKISKNSSYSGSLSISSSPGSTSSCMAISSPNQADMLLWSADTSTCNTSGTTCHSLTSSPLATSDNSLIAQSVPLSPVVIVKTEPADSYKPELVVSTMQVKTEQLDTEVDRDGNAAFKDEERLPLKSDTNSLSRKDKVVMSSPTISELFSKHTLVS